MKDKNHSFIDEDFTKIYKISQKYILTFLSTVVITSNRLIICDLLNKNIVQNKCWLN